MGKLTWRGDQVLDKTLTNVGRALTEFGLRVEASAKDQLYKGHGVITGTLRRSIHCATPGFNWLAEGRMMLGARNNRLRMKSVKKAMRGTSLGQQMSLPNIQSLHMTARPAMVGSVLTLQVGSGLRYALPVEVGFGSFRGYNYMAIGLRQNVGKLPGILRKYAMDK